ncbi:MAG: HAD hydrolase-like protein [Acutalibacteraceae bacterium]
MKCKYKVVFFDLDGTLSDSAAGVKQCIELALNEMNKPVPCLDDSSLYVGPPLLTTFKKLCGLCDEQALEAIELYRGFYESKGKYNNRLYDGMDRLLADIRKSGATICVATSKYEGFVPDVLEHIGIPDCFDMICGSNLDGSRKEKADVIRYACGKLGITPDFSCVLIGDSAFDALGAMEAGCDFIGVTYGFGKKEQLINLGADKLADTVDDIRRFIFTDFKCNKH